ncbi:hypothetical protein ACH5RR_039395 [Cinchona calisaya]|uniref:Uncharacterized protein n=1 Tax=Cinchona calisaya TaxID=153742 RepID=A0ABD2Y1J6_9GENT
MLEDGTSSLHTVIFSLDVEKLIPFTALQLKDDDENMVKLLPPYYLLCQALCKGFSRSTLTSLLEDMPLATSTSSATSGNTSNTNTVMQLFIPTANKVLKAIVQSSYYSPKADAATIGVKGNLGFVEINLAQTTHHLNLQQRLPLQTSKATPSSQFCSQEELR